VLLRADKDFVDMERRVLRTLKGSEFYAVYHFRAVPAFVGYASRDALSKLAANPDVAGVCLDEQPLPQLEHPTSEEFKAARPNEALSEEPGIREGKVEPAVYRAIERNERVNVIITLFRDSSPEETGYPMWPGEQERRASIQLQNRVLDGVNADDFWLHTRIISSPMIFGQITREGVKKLCTNPNVNRIELSRKVHAIQTHG
jgi:hypothetical protein